MKYFVAFQFDFFFFRAAPPPPNLRQQPLQQQRQPLQQPLLPNRLQQLLGEYYLFLGLLHHLQVILEEMSAQFLMITRLLLYLNSEHPFRVLHINVKFIQDVNSQNSGLSERLSLFAKDSPPIFG